MAGESIQIRFRHTSGDVGPFGFPPSSTILNLKERVCKEWEEAGTQIDGETIKSPSAVKLIFNGKFLEDNKSLAELKSSMGDQAMTTFHLVVRPGGSAKPAAKVVDQDSTPKNCGCVMQ